MPENSPEKWYYTLFGIFALAMSFSWIAFARLSMARIEREMNKDGLTRPSSWDGLGLRVLWYLYAIVLPVGDWNRADDPLIDVPAVRRYATRFDRILGVVFFVSGNAFVLIAAVGGWLLGLE
ncbi:hypothetical protein [Marinobacter sp.]|uniref:hypothetical protein n=1 Tax=Marinobacter sp. TaxID=50741 RepID=UPI00384CE6C7